MKKTLFASLLLIQSSLFSQIMTVSDISFLCQKQIKKTVLIDSNETFSPLNVELSQNTDYCSFLTSFMKHKKYKKVLNNQFVLFYLDPKFAPFKNDFKSYNLPDGNTPLSSFGYFPPSYDEQEIKSSGRTWKDDNKVMFELGKSQKFKSDANISFDSVSSACKSFTIYYPKSTKNDDYNTLLNSLKIDFKKLDDSYLICDDNKSIYDNFLTLASKIDELQKTAKIKITIFTSSKAFTRDIGLKLNGSMDFNFVHNVGLGGVSSGGYSILPTLYANELDNNITIKSSTDYYLTNNTQTVFENATTLPYIDENYVVTNQTTNQSTKYKFKSVGFKINLLPKITNEQILLNLDLSLESIVNITNNLPTTAGKTYKSIIPLTKQKEILLAGISDLTESHSKDSLPSWFDFLGRKTDLKKDETINILISWID